jgi:hypothetical protein
VTGTDGEINKMAGAEKIRGEGVKGEIEVNGPGIVEDMGGGLACVSGIVRTRQWM